MKLIDIIRLIIENKDLIFQIIEFLKEIGLIKAGDGVITLQATADGVAGEAEVPFATVQQLAVEQGFGENAIELIKLLLDNWQSIMELIKLIRG